MYPSSPAKDELDNQSCGPPTFGHMQIFSNRTARQLRQTSARGVCFLLLLCMVPLAIGPSPVSVRGLRSSESEAPPNESEEQPQKELIAHPERGNSAARRQAPCAVSRIHSSHVAAAAARRTSCDHSPSGHRLANGLCAPLRC